ncbi:MAG: TetR/AcrR family transcriptional regulator [Stackebrandtia sp.]
MTAKAARSPGPGRPRDPGADPAILRAAMDLLIERGVDGTSMERVAKRAGVAKVTVYRRWSSKEDLLADAIESLRDEIPAADQGDESARSLPDIVEDLLPQWGELLAQQRFQVLFARLFGAGPDHPKLLAAYREHHLRPRRERALATLQKARDAGFLPPDTDLEVVIDMMTGAITQYLLLGPGSATPADISAYLRRVLRQSGIGGLSP